MIRIAIVEDEKEYQDTLLSYIKRYREEHFADIATSVFSDGMDLVDDYHGGFDILLMDIKMKHLDGMKAAERSAVWIRQSSSSLSRLWRSTR